MRAQHSIRGARPKRGSHDPAAARPDALGDPAEGEDPSADCSKFFAVSDRTDRLQRDCLRFFSYFSLFSECARRRPPRKSSGSISLLLWSRWLYLRGLASDSGTVRTFSGAESQIFTLPHLGHCARAFFPLGYFFTVRLWRAHDMPSAPEVELPLFVHFIIRRQSAAMAVFCDPYFTTPTACLLLHVDGTNTIRSNRRVAIRCPYNILVAVQHFVNHAGHLRRIDGTDTQCAPVAMSHLF